MNTNLNCKEIFSRRFSELMKEHFPPINSHKKEKQIKQTAREDFALLQKLDINKANDCKNSIDRNNATATIRKWRNPLNKFRASSYLGLNQKTIQGIKDYSDIIKELIDVMVCNDNDTLKYILINILQYVRYFNIPRMTVQTISDEKPRELSYDEKQNYIKSVTMDELGLALHEINNRYEIIRESDFAKRKELLELEIQVERLNIKRLKEK